MSTELSKDFTSQIVAMNQGNQEIAALATSAGWLKQLRFNSSNSEDVKAGKVDGNTFSLVDGERVTNLGKRVDCLLLAYRPFAMDNSGEEVVVTHSMNLDENGHPSGLFADIKERADRLGMDSKCMYGPELLLWIPEVEQFAVLWCMSKTSRNEAVKMISDYMGKAMTLVGSFFKNSKYSWTAPVAEPCTTAFDLPDMSVIQKQVEAFKNPQDDTEIATGGSEEVEAGEGRER